MDNVKYSLKKDEKYGFMRVDPAPTDEQIRDFYAREFYSGDYKNFNNSLLEVQERDPEYHLAQRQMLLASVEKLLGEPIAGKRVFDFGCGWGLTLQFLRDQGAICHGVDPSPEAVEYCQSKSLKVSVGDIDNFGSISDEPFDVILMQNVLEHLRDPEYALKKLGEVLKRGGVIVCAVPNDFNELQLCATELHDLPQWWVAPPAHLSYFRPDSLKALMDGCDYRVELVECSFPLEMFLLFGDNYVGNPVLGRAAHEKRMNFEMALINSGRSQVLAELYQKLSEVGIGRVLTVFAVRR